MLKVTRQTGYKISVHVKWATCSHSIVFRFQITRVSANIYTYIYLFIYLSVYLFISGLFNNAVNSPDIYSLKWYCNWVNNY